MNEVNLEDHRGKRVRITFKDPSLQPLKGVIRHTGDYWEDGVSKPYPYEFNWEEGGELSSSGLVYTQSGCYPAFSDRNIVKIEELPPLLNLDKYSLEQLSELEEQIQRRKENWSRQIYKVTFCVEFNPAQHQGEGDPLRNADAFQKYVQEEVTSDLDRYCLLKGERVKDFLVESMG